MSVKVLCDPDTAACRGVGFVNFAEHDAAVRAMQALHGTKVRGAGVCGGGSCIPHSS